MTSEEVTSEEVKKKRISDKRYKTIQEGDKIPAVVSLTEHT